MPDDLLDAHVALRLAATSAHPCFPADPGAAAAHLTGKLRELHTSGTVRAFRTRAGVQGVLAWCHDPSPWYGVPVSTVAIDIDPSAPGVDDWLAEALDAELPSMEADLDLLVDACYPSVGRALLRRGVGIEAVILVGRAHEALERLSAGDVRSLPAGVALGPIAPEHVEALVELERETFAAAPEYCWFGAAPRYLDGYRKELMTAATEGDPLVRVLLVGGEPRGIASGRLRGDPLWGRISALGLTFAPELRGRGLARAVYVDLLRHAVAAGAVAMKGGTSQPGVMRLGVEAGRTLQAVVMRRGATFSAGHFGVVLERSAGWAGLGTRMTMLRDLA